MRRQSAIVALALMGFFVFAATSHALLKDLTKEELIVESECIVLGKVQETCSTWADDRSQIYTYVTLEISEQYKGEDLGNSVVVQIPGGKVGEITQVTSDTPKNLDIGAEVILHLFMKETGYYWVYGWEKGSLTVENGAIPDYLMTMEQFRQMVKGTLK